MVRKVLTGIRDIIASHSNLTNGLSEEEIRVVEQRMDACSDCVLNKKCLHCGCKIPEKMFSMQAKCPQGKW